MLSNGCLRGGGGFGGNFKEGAFEAVNGASRFDVVGDVSPEPEGAGEERIAVAVHRRVRDKIAGFSSAGVRNN